MKNILQQVLTLSDRTMKHLINQSYYRNFVFFGSDESNEYIEQVRSELSSFIENNPNRFNTWLVAFNAFIEYKKGVTGKALYEFCLDHVQHYSGMPMDFEIKIFGKQQVIKLALFEYFLTSEQRYELNTLLES